MNPSELLAFLRAHHWAIEASSSLDGAPQAAIIGFAVTDQLELVFDTLSSSRKAANLRVNPRLALVIGGWNEAQPKTLQYEGDADFPGGDELERLRQTYFKAFPNGPTRLSWPGITYVRVRPRWVRFSDFSVEPPAISEHTSFE
ncbi:MAG TPA: pyridoxamine 5'-phosphate oxidase family protein [Rhizobacter sp.]|nr:pyridoxamine 5'-phosphate oxidase family protein [Rhizobacter sp.]